MFINYAHRGASAYAPENTMRAFRLGVELGANGIETDIRKTKEGVPVLFHDETLLRLTGIDGKPADYTYGELAKIQIPSPDGSCTDKIPTLEEFLRFAADKPVSLALELKADGLEADVIREIVRFGVAERCIVTSFKPAYLRKVKLLDRSIQTGLLTAEISDGTAAALKELGAEQICPKASLLSPELVSFFHGEGFSVRAWGIRDEETMKKAYLCGVDGMTVNFPDRLNAFIRQQQATR